MMAAASLWANVEEIYRVQGVEALKAYLDQRLAQETYWQKRLEQIDTTYGFFDAKEVDILVCDKSRTNLEIYRYYEGNVQKLADYPAALGKYDGDKFVEGDLRTPVGAYSFTSRLTALDPFYGPLALVTDYPNLLDKKWNKNGGGIWLHGYPLSGEDKEATKGCIAIKNQQLQELDKSIDYRKSLLLISENGRPVATKEHLAKVLSALYRWRLSWKENDYQQYISFYDPQFSRYDGMDYKSFVAYKKRVFSRDRDKEIRFEDVEVVPYPNSLGEIIYRVRFFEKYAHPGYRFEGEKELYVKLDGERVSILLEK